MKSFRLFAVALVIVLSTAIAGTVHAAETPRFTAPNSGQTYTQIPDVRWTSPENASEHQIFVMCYGCLKETSFLPLTYRFTVHQPYLVFSYTELKNFLRRHKITPDDQVRIRLYVRSKVDGKFTKWSSAMEFFAHDAEPKRSEMRTRVVVDDSGMATVYGYSDRRQNTMQLSVGSTLLGNTSITCRDVSYCVLRGIGPLSPGRTYYGLILNDDYMTDFRIDVPKRVTSEPVRAKIFPRENNDGSVTFYNYTEGRKVVDIVEIYIDGQLVRTCTYANYCAYRKQVREEVEYAIRTMHNASEFFSGYTVYTPAEDTTASDSEANVVPLNVRISETVYQGTNTIMVQATTENNQTVDRLNILVNAKLKNECKNTNVCTTYIPRDELGSTFTYGVNSYINGNRYWSGYKGKRI